MALLPPEGLVGEKFLVRLGEPDIDEHAVIERGELRTVAAAPAPLAQRGEDPVGRVAERIKRGVAVGARTQGGGAGPEMDGRPIRNPKPSRGWKVLVRGGGEPQIG